MRDVLLHGLGVNPRLTGLAPLIGFVVGAVGVALNNAYSDGDLRAGVLPWTMIVAVVCLAACGLGIIAVHSEDSNWFVVIGGWWCVLAFLGIAGFFLTIGIGAAAGIEEDDVPELLTYLPVMSMAFGLLSMTPATALFAFGATRARVMPLWGIVGMWVATPILPLLLILG
ncbi:MAG: hypothetical protein ACR2N7_04920, partial [Acidimicrobiia bacterium]